MVEMSMRERALTGMTDALKAHCTNLRGECYAHGFTSCQQEGGWCGEVDGEFDLEVLLDAVLEALREPDERMWLATQETLQNSSGHISREDFMAAYTAMIDHARNDGR